MTPARLLRRGRRLLAAAVLGLLTVSPVAQKATASVAQKASASVGGGLTPRVGLASLAQQLLVPAFQLDRVDVSTSLDEAPKAKMVTADFLGPGVGNSVRIIKFGGVRQAKTFIERQYPERTPTAAVLGGLGLAPGQASPPSVECSVRTMAVCVAQIGRTVVSGTSGSTCHSLNPQAQERALKLLGFGLQLHQS